MIWGRAVCGSSSRSPTQEVTIRNINNTPHIFCPKAQHISIFILRFPGVILEEDITVDWLNLTCILQNSSNAADLNLETDVVVYSRTPSFLNTVQQGIARLVVNIFISVCLEYALHRPVLSKSKASEVSIIENDANRG